MARKSNHALIFSTCLFALAACSTQQGADNSAREEQTSDLSDSVTSADAALLAAAEPFEALTEQAPSAAPDRLKSLIAETTRASNSASAALAAPRREELAKAQADIAGASEVNDRVAIALAAVEGYRTLVEATSGTGPVPVSVSLLDYAGFRYQADLTAEPVRWDDAIAALDFADEQWASIENEVSDAALRSEFSASLADMRAAVVVQSKSQAHTAALRELDLVDKLEEAFASAS